MTYSAVLLPTLPSKVRNITQYYYRNQSAIGAANPYWLQSCKVVGTTSQSLDCIVSPALGVCSSALHICSAFVWQSVFEQRTEDTYALFSPPPPPNSPWMMCELMQRAELWRGLITFWAGMQREETGEAGVKVQCY